MNERIKELAEKAAAQSTENFVWEYLPQIDKDIFSKFAELIVTEAFRAGILYSAKKYTTVSEDRFTGNDVALFLEMEACELSDTEIKEHFGVKE